MDCSPAASSVHVIYQARILEWVAMHTLFQEIFLTQGSNPHFLHLQVDSILGHLESPQNNFTEI